MQPVVDGPLTLTSYLGALDGAYSTYKAKYTKRYSAPAAKKSLANGMHALDAAKAAAAEAEAAANGNGHANGEVVEKQAVEVKVTADSFDYLVFHSPYGKLVQKGHARMFFNVCPSRGPTGRSSGTDPLMNPQDFLENPSHPSFANIPAEFAQLDRFKSLTDKAVEKAMVAHAKPHHKAAVEPGSDCVKRCGNMYTASLYGGLASLLSNASSEELVGCAAP